MRDITQLHPLARMLAEALEAKAAARDLYIKITDCVRSKDEQNGIDASRTNVKYPYSFHNWGLAFDICFNSKNNPYPSDPKVWDEVGKIAESIGLEWGGRWVKPVDKPHFQLNAYGTCVELIKKYGSPKGFFKHKDFKISTPKTPITPASSFKKILWMQVRLSVNGFTTKLTGKWDAGTKKALKAYWKTVTGKECTGKLCSVKCINLLS